VPPEGHAGLDAVYLAALGDDAVPEIVADLASDTRTTGWPAWNRAREQARQALGTRSQ
jgi:hypothetical protein